MASTLHCVSGRAEAERRRHGHPVCFWGSDAGRSGSARRGWPRRAVLRQSPRPRERVRAHDRPFEFPDPRGDLAQARVLPMEPSLGLHRQHGSALARGSDRVRRRPRCRYLSLTRPPGALPSAVGNCHAATIRLIRAKSAPRRPSPQSSRGHPGCTRRQRGPALCPADLSAPPAGGLRPLPHLPGAPSTPRWSCYRAAR